MKLIPKLLLLSLGSAGLCQSTPTLRTGSEVAEQPAVTLVLAITDEHGKPTENVQPESIQVLDDKQPTVPIVGLHSATDLPLHVAAVIDVSNSVRQSGVFGFEVQALTAFINRVLVHNHDDVIIEKFETVIAEDGGFMNRQQLAKQKISLQFGGGSAMYDAVLFASRERLGKTAEPGRRVMVLISDGEDNQSRVPLKAAIAAAQKAGVVIFTLSTNTLTIHGRGDDNLRHLSDETGGAAFFPLRRNSAEEAFARIEDSLRAEYLLSFKPGQPPSGTFHSLEVHSSDKNVKVHVQKSYFSEIPSSTRD